MFKFCFHRWFEIRRETHKLDNMLSIMTLGDSLEVITLECPKCGKVKEISRYY